MRHQLSRPVAQRTQSCLDLLKCLGQALFPQDLQDEGLRPAAPGETCDSAPRGLPQTQQQKAKGWLDRMLMAEDQRLLIHVYHNRAVGAERRGMRGRINCLRSFPMAGDQIP